MDEPTETPKAQPESEKQERPRKKAPEFPKTFTPHQVNLLRILLILARGQVGKWSQIDGLLEKVKQPDLNKFAHEGSKLGFDRGQFDRIRHIYECVYSFLAYDDAGILRDIEALFSQVYGKQDTKSPDAGKPQIGWEIVDREGASLRVNQIDAYAKECEGEFEVFRYGTDPADGGEIIQSALQITRGAGDRLFFEARYPPTNLPARDAKIAGNVECMSDYYFLMGYDYGNRSPYLLALRRGAEDGPVQHLSGVLLRRTQKGPLLAARVYIERTKRGWDQARDDVDKWFASSFETQHPEKFARMKDHINNAVDNVRNYVLTSYERPKKGKPDRK